MIKQKILDINTKMKNKLDITDKEIETYSKYVISILKKSNAFWCSELNKCSDETNKYRVTCLHQIISNEFREEVLDLFRPCWDRKYVVKFHQNGTMEKVYNTYFDTAAYFRGSRYNLNHWMMRKSIKIKYFFIKGNSLKIKEAYLPALKLNLKKKLGYQLRFREKLITGVKAI